MDDLLNILKVNAKQTPEEIARMLDRPVEEVRSRIAEYERQGIIRGYQAIVNEDRLETGRVTAIIELKVTPERDRGFDQVATRISKFPEVRSVHLVSGAFDLLLFVEGESLREVASFVSEKLAPVEGIKSTATHFMLKSYKTHGIVMGSEDEYERLQVSP